MLEGAPALSEYWTLFETNDAVFEAGRTAQAATLLFSITQNEQIEQLGRYIHTLRRQRGSALKKSWYVNKRRACAPPMNACC